MRYEIKGADCSAVIDDKGIHIEVGGMMKQSRFIPYGKLVAVSVKKPVRG